MATWALVLAVLPAVSFWIVAFGLAVTVLRRGRDGRDHGRRRAIAAIVVALLWTLVLIAYLISLAGGAQRNDVTGEVETAGAVSVMSLAEGDCMDEEPGTGDTYTVDLVPCGELHRSEVYATFDLAPGAWPGDDDVIRLSEGGCLDRLETMLGDAFALLPVEMYYLHPLEDYWTDDRGVVCFAVYPRTTERLSEMTDSMLAELESSSA